MMGLALNGGAPPPRPPSPLGRAHTAVEALRASALYCVGTAFCLKARAINMVEKPECVLWGGLDSARAAHASNIRFFWIGRRVRGKILIFEILGEVLCVVFS